MPQSDQTAQGKLDITEGGFGWLRPTAGDSRRVLVTASQIRRYGLRQDDRLLVRVKLPRRPGERERWVGTMLAINGAVPDPQPGLDAG